MADPENSRTLPIVTRRNLLSGALISASPFNEIPDTCSPFQGTLGAEDPALVAANKWLRAHERYTQLLHRRWELGEKLIWLVFGCRPKVDCNGVSFIVPYAEGVNPHSGEMPNPANSQEKTIKEMKGLDAAWNESDRRIGYSKTLKMEKSARELRSKLAMAVGNTPAQSAVGAAAKLRCFIEMSTPVIPWSQDLHPGVHRPQQNPSCPELRSLLADLDRMTMATSSRQGDPRSLDAKLIP